MNKLTAVAYYSGIPPNNTNPEKPLILDNFLNGVKTNGDIAIAHRGSTLIDCDVALIQGFVHERSKNAPHLNLRKSVIDYQRSKNRRSLIVDSNLFLYADPGNSNAYLRYSFDGVFPTTGFYFDKNIDSNRWKQISKNLGLTLKPYRQSGEHVLICLQRNGGWSMQGLDINQWLSTTVKRIRQYSPRRPIVIRGHPGDKKTKLSFKLNLPNVRISNNQKLVDDLKNAWATVVYNSSPSVASLIEGIPVFITDPVPQNSQSFEAANTDLSSIENPKMPDRQAWIEKLSMCHWNFDELKSGEAWKFFRQYI